MSCLGFGRPPRFPLYRTAYRQCYAHKFFQHDYVTASRLSECCVLRTLAWPKAHSNPKAPNQGLLLRSLPFQAVSRAVGVHGWGTLFLKGTMRKNVTGCGTSMSKASEVCLSWGHSGNLGSNSCLQGAEYERRHSCDGSLSSWAVSLGLLGALEVGTENGH